MTHDNIVRSRVRELIAHSFGLAPESLEGPVKVGSPPQWDSLGHMSLVAKIEAAFGITFPTYEIAELTSEEKIVTALVERGAAV